MADLGEWRSSWPPDGLARTTARVAAALKVEGPASRTRLRELTGLSRPTVAGAVNELEQAGLITSAEAASTPEQPVGRPAEVVRLSRRAGLVVGADFGHRHVQAVLADLGHQRIDTMPSSDTDSYLHSPDAATTPTEAISRVAGLLRSLLDRNGARLSDVTGVGLAIRAPVTRAGVVGSSTLLPAWAGLRPGEVLSAELGGVPVYVDNDASLGALGEWLFGMRAQREPGRDHELVYIRLGAGIGAGMVRNGRLHRGANGTAGEFGHITLNHLERMPCSCGSHGCLEYYAGGLSILERARTQRPEIRNLTDLVTRAVDGDRLCTTLIQDAGDMVGLGLGTLVNLNSPHDIIIGGTLSTAGEILLGPIRDKLHRTAMPPAVQAVNVDLARLGRWSTTWGGAALALHSDTAPEAS